MLEDPWTAAFLLTPIQQGKIRVNLNSQTSFDIIPFQFYARGTKLEFIESLLPEFALSIAR